MLRMETGPIERQKLLEKERDLCLLTANLYHIRDKEKKAGLQRMECNLSDIEDYDEEQYRKKQVKKMLEKIKEDKNPENPVIYPDPNKLIIQIE